MKKIDSEIRLREAIVALENKQAEEKRLMKEQFQAVYEGMQPLNLLKKTFKTISETQDIKQDIINTSLGLGVGYLSKRILRDTSKKPSKKLIGAAVLLGFTAVILKNPHTVKTIGASILNTFLNKSNDTVSEEEEDEDD